MALLTAAGTIAKAHIKANSRWSRDFIIKNKTIKTLEIKHGRIFFNDCGVNTACLSKTKIPSWKSKDLIHLSGKEKKKFSECQRVL